MTVDVTEMENNKKNQSLAEKTGNKSIYFAVSQDRRQVERARTFHLKVLC